MLEQDIQLFMEIFGNLGIVGIGVYLIFSMIRRERGADARLDTMLDEGRKMRADYQAEVNSLRDHVQKNDERYRDTMQRLGEKLDKALEAERECQRERIGLLTQAIGLSRALTPRADR